MEPASSHSVMTRNDITTKYYDSARQELIERIRLRDNSLFVYLGAVGALFGAVLAKAISYELLLVVPYLTLGAAFLISQHHEVIGGLESYLVQELEPYLMDVNEDEKIPQWNNSASLQAYYSQAMLSRLIAHSILLLAPSFAALALNFSVISTFPQNAFWGYGCLCFIISLHAIIKAHKWRVKNYESFSWKTRENSLKSDKQRTGQ